MPRLVVFSAAEQVAAHLHAELRRGTWSGTMPGGDRLAAELGIGRDTVEAALKRLEEDGLLASQGRRRGRLIVPPTGEKATRRIRVAILPGEKDDRRLDYVVEFEHELQEAGHRVFYAPYSISDGGMDPQRIKRMVEKTDVDAWVVVAGSREMLEWFSMRKQPAFALFGRRDGLPMAAAGPDKQQAYAAATRMLVELGHRRIVLLAREGRRLPKPGQAEQAFLDELSVHGINPGPYHLPEWEMTADGFHGRLDALFKVTPPSALIIDEVQFFVSVLQFCASCGIRVPLDISLVCTDPDRTFAWCRPTVAHIRWGSSSLSRRIVQWADNVSRGKNDLRQALTIAEFVPGGTIGPARV